MPLMPEKSVAASSLPDRYQFTRKLANSGWCDVFHAFEKGGRQVAIKMMRIVNPGDKEEDRRIARFRREMRLCSRLQHPGIVATLDAGETDENLLYIVFEYIEGLTLSELLRKQGALTVDFAVDIATQVLEALAYAHKNGIVHRDLKPENIMVTQIDARIEAKVLDFGISALMPSQWGEQSRLTLAREFLGTPSCASPEQLRGEPVGPKADIYAWGITFLECLTGKSPFSDASVAGIVQQQLSSSPVQLPHLLRDHPLGTLLRWALEKSPSRRAGSSEHLLDRLRSIAFESIPQKNGYLLLPDSLPRQDGRAEETSHRAQTPQLERRQISVLCLSLSVENPSDQASSDVVDEIYHDLLQLCIGKARDLGGYVATESGDRLLVYFGYPHASDTDSRRSIRAALVLADLLLRRCTFLMAQHGFMLSHQVGVHTGMVTVRAAGQNQDRISGITPNIAAKLCGSAPPNTILISEESYALLKHLIECEPVYPLPPSSSAPARRAYRVIGERSMEGLAGLTQNASNPMVGREFEREMIVRIWNEIKLGGKGKAILLQGEAGIGKSRLAAECAATIQREGRAGWLECRFTAESRNSPLFNVLESFKEHIGFPEKGRTAQEQSRHLEKRVRAMGMPYEEVMPLLCAWLEIPDNDYPLPPYSPQKIKDLFLEHLASLMAHLARESDAVIMLEDLHWIDPTSLELLPLLVKQVHRSGLLLLLSARPEFEPAWDHSEMETLRLGSLDGREVEKLIVGALQGTEIEPELLYSMVERSGGIALFALELARMYLERVRDRKSDRSTRMTSADIEIPSSLRDLLAGRLDRMGPAKETAQVAAALGRTFPFNVLAKASWRDEAMVLSDLDQLVSEGLLHVRLRVGNPEYQFQHALVRDAAYDSLPSKSKNELHLRIAETLENEFPDTVEHQPEILAMHWAGAGEYRKAIEHGTKAAGGALAKSLVSEAISHSQTVLAWIQKAPRENRNPMELAINGVLTQAMMFKFGWAYPRVRELIERSRNLLGVMPSSEHTFPTLWAVATYHHVASNRKEVRELTDELGALAAKNQDPGQRVAADTFLGLRYQADGDFALSAEHLERAVAGYDPGAHSNHGEIFGLDTRVWSAATLALVRWNRGYDEEAEEMRGKALLWAQETNHKPSIAINLMYRALAFQAMGDKHAVLETAGELVGMSEQFGLPAYSAYGGILLSWATGQIEKADAITKVLTDLGCRLCVPLYKSLAADNEAEAGDFPRAIARLDACIALCNELDERFYLPVLFFRKGIFLGLMDTALRESIIQSFETAAGLARNSGMLRLELSALCALRNLAPSPEWGIRLEQIVRERPALIQNLKSH